jgi:hypothetical protein
MQHYFGRAFNVQPVSKAKFYAFSTIHRTSFALFDYYMSIVQREDDTNVRQVRLSVLKLAVSA